MGDSRLATCSLNRLERGRKFESLRLLVNGIKVEDSGFLTFQVFRFSRFLVYILVSDVLAFQFFWFGRFLVLILTWQIVLSVFLKFAPESWDTYSQWNFAIRCEFREFLNAPMFEQNRWYDQMLSMSLLHKTPYIGKQRKMMLRTLFSKFKSLFASCSCNKWTYRNRSCNKINKIIKK